MQLIQMERLVLSMVVLPELSSPTISILISFFPTNLPKILLKKEPMLSFISIYNNPVSDLKPCDSNPYKVMNINYFMMEDEQERRDNKDRYQNIINLVKLMTLHHSTIVRRIVDNRIELLHQNANKDEIQEKFRVEKKKLLEKSMSFRDLLRKSHRELLSNQPKITRPSLNPSFVEECMMVEEKDRCFEERGQGIRFWVNQRMSEMVISLYTVRNGESKSNIFHQKIQKRISLYFHSLRNERRGKSAVVLFKEFKDKYFQLLRKMQDSYKVCDLCKEALKYCEKENLWLPLTTFTFKDELKFFHEICYEEKYA